MCGLWFGGLEDFCVEGKKACKKNSIHMLMNLFTASLLKSKSYKTTNNVGNSHKFRELTYIKLLVKVIGGIMSTINADAVLAAVVADISNMSTVVRSIILSPPPLFC